MIGNYCNEKSFSSKSVAIRERSAIDITVQSLKNLDLKIKLG